MNEKREAKTVWRTKRANLRKRDWCAQPQEYDERHNDTWSIFMIYEYSQCYASIENRREDITGHRRISREINYGFRFRIQYFGFGSSSWTFFRYCSSIPRFSVIGVIIRIATSGVSRAPHGDPRSLSSVPPPRRFLKTNNCSKSRRTHEPL